MADRFSQRPTSRELAAAERATDRLLARIMADRRRRRRRAQVRPRAWLLDLAIAMATYTGITVAVVLATIYGIVEAIRLLTG